MEPWSDGTLWDDGTGWAGSGDVEMSQQGLKQASFQAIHGGDPLTYNGDAMAAMAAELTAAEAVVPDTYNGRMIAWLQLRLDSTEQNINGLQAGFAAAEGATNWDSLGTFGPSYTPIAANFDGSTYLTRGADLTGVSDSGVWAGSMWIRQAVGTAAFNRVFQSANDRYGLLFSGDGSLGTTTSYFFAAQNAAGTPILDYRPEEVATRDTNWHHLLWQVDLPSEEASVYIDDVLVAAGGSPILTDDDMDFTAGNLGIGADASGNNKFAGDIAAVWMRFGGAVIDFSVEANRRLFIKADGTPANPAGWPSGGQIELYGPVDDWHVNKSTGGGFTLNGTLGEGSSPVAVGSGP